jgi:6-phosphogluconolactonase
MASFYLASLSEKDDGGVYKFSIADKSVTQTGFVSLRDLNYIIFSPNRQLIYATCQHQPIGSISALRISGDSLEPVNSVESGANCPCYASVNASGTFLYAANYGENGDAALSEFPLGPDGSLLPLSKLIRHPPGSGPVADRQDGPHVHCACVTPDSRYVVAVDLGIDALKCYPIDARGGIDEGGVVTTVTEPGAGPRHVLFEPSGDVAYVANELGNSVTSYRFSEGTFTAIKTVSTIPGYYKGFTKVAALKFTPDGKGLVVSNRGFDSVAIYAIDNTGGLDLKNIVYSIGQAPRDLGFVAGTNYLVVTNVATNNATVFEYVPGGYTLVPLSDVSIALPGPLGIIS